CAGPLPGGGAIPITLSPGTHDALPRGQLTQWRARSYGVRRFCPGGDRGMRLGKMKLHGAWLLPALALLTACSGIPLKQREAAQRAEYEAYAGAPVDQFTWLLGHYDSWQPIGTNELVVWTTPFQAYLIKVAPPCENLQFADRIGLTSAGNTVSARFDFVKVGH